jgi:Zn-dependent protease
MFGSETICIPEGYGRIRFGRTEMLHILIAVLVLTFAFTIFIYLGMDHHFTDVDVFALTLSFGMSFVIVVTGFLLHELAHKFVAQRYGAWAEFRIFPIGLFLALAFSFLGFVFAAPGAVYIQGNISKRQNGLISLAGPFTNLAFGGAFLLGWMLLPAEGDLSSVLSWVGLVNLFFAAFNLLPIPPFDGSKVIKWNIGVYAIVLAVTIVLLSVGFGVI